MFQAINSFLYSEKTLPVAIIALSAAAGLRYLIDGDLGRSIYWFSGAVLMMSVTFWIK